MIFQLLDDFDTIMPELSDFDYAPGPLQNTQGRIDDITLQEDNFDTLSMRGNLIDDFGDTESNFEEEFERTRRNFQMLQKSGRGSGGMLFEMFVLNSKNYLLI
jgi:hypothetical protein